MTVTIQSQNTGRYAVTMREWVETPEQAATFETPRAAEGWLYEQCVAGGWEPYVMAGNVWIVVDGKRQPHGHKGLGNSDGPTGYGW